jgi:hypothetical protein
METSRLERANEQLLNLQALARARRLTACDAAGHEASQASEQLKVPLARDLAGLTNRIKPGPGAAVSPIPPKPIGDTVIVYATELEASWEIINAQKNLAAVRARDGIPLAQAASAAPGDQEWLEALRPQTQTARLAPAPAPAAPVKNYP